MTTQPGDVVRFVYNSANQIKCVDADNSQACDNGEFLYLYDAYGNLLNDGASTYTYDAENRLIATTTGGVNSSYIYSGDGDRISQTVDSTLTTYLLDMATPLTMVLSETTSGVTTKYWHGLDLLAQSDGTDTEFLAYDGLGSVRQVTDATGLVQYAQTFDPYGNLYADSGVNSTSYAFSGEQQDSNGLLFLRARYYSAGMGRFVNSDPSRQEQNAFTYAIGNPIIFTDPSGNNTWTSGCQYLVDQNTRIICQAGWDYANLTYSIGDCGIDQFCKDYGQKIAQRAHLLDRISWIPAGQTVAINIIPVLPGTEPPFQQWTFGTTVQYVCADVIKDAYLDAGIDLEALMRSALGNAYEQDPSRAAYAYYDYLKVIGHFRLGSDFPYYAGEVVVLYDASLYERILSGEIDCGSNQDDCVADGKGFHAGVVVHGGSGLDDVKIVQASYTTWQVEEVSLRTYAIDRTAFHGFARDELLSNPATNPYTTNEADWPPNTKAHAEEDGRNIASSKSPNELLDRFIFHGHP